MTREIKFKFWDKDSKLMAEDYYIITYDGSIYVDYYGDQPKEENVIALQYTGRKDKNGKEIYEGDIVKCQYSESVDEIRYLDGAFIIGGWEDPLYIKNMDLYEVIGNMYENPELLENNK